MRAEKQSIHQEASPSSYLFFDFGKAAFAQLDMELEGICQDLVEVVIGEEAKDGHIIRSPGSWRTYKCQTFVLKDGVHTYHFDIPAFRTAYGVSPYQPTPAECHGEIAPFRYAEIHHYYQAATFTRTAYFCDMDLQAASFECPALPWFSDLWEFCRYSIRATSVFDCYVDGERERLPYEADCYIGQLSHFCVDTNFAISKRTIQYFMDNGHLTYPTEWHLQVPALVQDYLLYSGDAESVKQWLPRLPEKLLPQLRGKDGLLYPVPGQRIRDIVDWPELDRDGYEFGLTNFVPDAFYLGALRQMTELTGEEKYSRDAEWVKQTLHTVMWHDGLPVDTIGSRHTSLHTAVCALKFGIADTPEEKQALLKLILSKGMHCSVYFAQFVLETCFRFGLDEFAVARLDADDIRSWKNMLRSGSTITMEAWNDTLKPNQDWTHAWGSAPGNILPRWYCGIRPLSPGFRSFTVAPSPLATDFSYLQPTIHGGIRVTRKNGNAPVVEFLPKEGVALQLEKRSDTEFVLK